MAVAAPGGVGPQSCNGRTTRGAQHPGTARGGALAHTTQLTTPPRHAACHTRTCILAPSAALAKVPHTRSCSPPQKSTSQGCAMATLRSPTVYSRSPRTASLTSEHVCGGTGQRAGGSAEQLGCGRAGCGLSHGVRAWLPCAGRASPRVPQRGKRVGGREGWRSGCGFCCLRNGTRDTRPRMGAEAGEAQRCWHVVRARGELHVRRHTCASKPYTTVAWADVRWTSLRAARRHSVAVGGVGWVAGQGGERG